MFLPDRSPAIGVLRKALILQRQGSKVARRVLYALFSASGRASVFLAALSPLEGCSHVQETVFTYPRSVCC